MKILVLGGAGCMGNAIVRDLLESPKVSEVIVGDIDISKAEMLVKELNNPKVTTAYVNATDHSVLVKALKDVDVLVNATWYYFNVLVMEAAIEAKVHYLDLGGLYHKTLEQLKLSEKVEHS
jgi:saccharopine dehydrogenase (NAD+, L-lysine-forming)